LAEAVPTSCTSPEAPEQQREAVIENEESIVMSDQEPKEEADPLSVDELRAHTTEPLPDREVMSTLLWAPAPGLIPPPQFVDGDGT
jgi:hypothetical protein